MLRVGIFGCTGSIGRNAIEIVRMNAGRARIVALAAGSQEAELRRLSEELGVERIALGGLSANGIASGPDALRSLAASDEMDLVINSVVGAAGLAVTLGALDRGTDIALANKESLVMAGEYVMNLAASRRVALRPIDSEHASLANCLRGRRMEEILAVYLTASGGPFRGRAAGSFDDVSVEEALNHPTWKMGPKITIDSATLMNKALEIIEAHHLFGIPPEKIRVIVHPQSIIHAMVEQNDGSLIAELAPPDMRIPIQRAIFPEAENGAFRVPLDLASMSGLTFEEVDHEAFPALSLAYEALEKGGTSATVLNAANEVAVKAYFDGRIRFGDIVRIVRRTLDASAAHSIADEKDVYEADAKAKRCAEELVARA